jgi:metallo-beta-lactamase family protein
MKLTFHGAAREVTGSCYLVESGNLRFIVDCGMFQGGRTADARNRHFPGFDPESLDFVLLTHAHIDHSGLLPRLAAMGYRGPVHCTHATADLLSVLLPDSAHIQEKEAEWANYANRKNRRRRIADLAPLYTVTQARDMLKTLRGVRYDKEIRPHPRVRARFQDAGHILGSAIIEVWVEEGGVSRKLVFPVTSACLAGRF